MHARTQIGMHAAEYSPTSVVTRVASSLDGPRAQCHLTPAGPLLLEKAVIPSSGKPGCTCWGPALTGDPLPFREIGPIKDFLLCVSLGLIKSLQTAGPTFFSIPKDLLTIAVSIPHLILNLSQLLSEDTSSSWEVACACGGCPPCFPLLFQASASPPPSSPLL